MQPTHTMTLRHEGNEATAEVEQVTSETRIRAAQPESSSTTLDDEQRLVSVVAVSPVPGSGLAPALERARAAAGPFGARVEKLGDGTILAALSRGGSVRDQAALAARCALALRDAVGSGSVALATGRAERGPSGLAGEVVDRAASLLAECRARAEAAWSADGEVATDAVTAALVEPRFEVVASRSGGLRLCAARPASDLEEARTVLGQPTPFHGRDAELAELHAAVDACIRDREASAVLVVAPAGGGKSRLRAELLRVLRARGDAEIWLARGDPTTAGSAFGMLAQVVLAAAGVAEDDGLRVRQAKLLVRLSHLLPGPDAQRVAEFMGELAGIRFPEARSEQLRAARRSVTLMGDGMRRAWGDFLSAACASHPVVLVLEDLHWCDAATMSFVDDALRELRASPLFVLALARPEVRELFPRLWADRAPLEMQLGGLADAASHRIARAVVGSRLDEGTRRRVVERAAGNPFYLEELLRSAVEGRVDEPPASVLAMIQSHLERLPPPLRRLLRAASVFGPAFWREAVEVLLGGAAVGEQLGELVARGIVSRSEGGALPHPYVFRHALVRDAAYAMLTQEDRAYAHRMAGAWLEQAGEADAMTLAAHYARGGDERAGALYVRAAKQALDANDLAAVIARAEMGLACGASAAEDIGALRVLEAEARRWRGETARAEKCAVEAMRNLPQRTAGWFDAAGELAATASRLYHYDRLEELVDSLCAEVDEPAASRQVVACATAAIPFVLAGKAALAGRLLDRACRGVARGCATDPAVLAHVNRARATRELFEGDLAAGLALTEQTIVAFEAAGDPRRACLQRMNAGYAHTMLGAYPRAETTLRAALTAAQRLGIVAVAAMARHNLGLALAHRGALHEARATETAAMEAALEQGDAHLAACSRAYLAQILVIAGNYWAAEREALAAREIIDDDPVASSYTLAVLSRARLGMGRVRESIAAALEAVSTIDSLGAIVEGEAQARLVHAEALWAWGDGTGARIAIASAHTRLRARARRIGDPALRRSFLQNVPSNARTLTLAQEWRALAGGDP
jgi:hypothetical protein